MQILIENSLIKKRSEALTYKISYEIMHKAYRSFEQLESAIYPLDEDSDSKFEVYDSFTLDDIIIYQIKKNNEFYWVPFGLIIEGNNMQKQNH